MYLIDRLNIHFNSKMQIKKLSVAEISNYVFVQ